MAYERAQGREPVDRRYAKGYPGDIESPPRIIEIKATSTSYRGWFLPLAPIQLEHAREDPTFHIYVIENVGQGDPAQFSLRILSGDQLRALAAKATPRTSYEVPWPVADYDETPIKAGPVPLSASPPVAPEVAGVPPSRIDPDGPAVQSEVSVAIEEALRSLGSEADVRDIEAAVEASHPGRWRSVETDIADLVHPGSPSSGYPPEQRILERVRRGRYRLRG